MKKIALLALGLSAILLSEINAATGLSFEEREVDRGLAHQQLYVQEMRDCVDALSHVQERQAFLRKAQSRFNPQIVQTLEDAISAVGAVYKQLELQETYCQNSLGNDIADEVRGPLDTAYGQCAITIRSLGAGTGFMGRLPAINGDGEDVNEFPITYDSLGLAATSVQSESAAQAALGSVLDAKSVCKNRLGKYTSYLESLKKDQVQLSTDIAALMLKETEFLGKIGDVLGHLKEISNRE